MQNDSPFANARVVAFDLVAFVAFAAAIALAAAIVLVGTVLLLAGRAEAAPADWIAGGYVFPRPENAAVERLQLRVGDRRISA